MNTGGLDNLRRITESLDQLSEGKTVATLCIICGKETSRWRGRCTNGCCRECHHALCSSGGDITPGHALPPSVIRAAR